jgi:cytochrome c5
MFTTVLMASLACGPQAPAQRSDTKAAGDSTQVASAANDRLLLAALRVALPPPGVSAQDLPDPHAPGAGFLAEFCTRCHNLPTPTIHSATDWPSVVRRMWLRMDRLSPEFGVPIPTPAQRQVMLAYLIDNALKVSGADLPAGPGRATFSQVCSRCHSLPDPRQHSPDDWPAVVMRMETRMQQMQVNRPQQAQMQEILAYLQQSSGAKRGTKS